VTIEMRLSRTSDATCSRGWRRRLRGLLLPTKCRLGSLASASVLAHLEASCDGDDAAFGKAGGALGDGAEAGDVDEGGALDVLVLGVGLPPSS
jgi:hypothetical protein